ncbi:MAG: hypothetical protein AAF267_16055 [Deinococcota bacterium]
MNQKRLIILGILLVASLSACAPRASTTSTTSAQGGGRRVIIINNPAANEVIQTVDTAWHRMQLNFLENGSYSTNVLVDLVLPQGVRWVLEDFTAENYRIRFVASDIPEVVWLITPEGVETVPVS